MEIFYLFIIIVLILLAISDLVVGVSNDAVNFVNSAIGSKAATFRTVMIVAAFGVLIGATFSSGMMEVARKGIFNPEFFHFNEIMIIFLAVMITDVILLDLFNTAGMPTSTTVSLVFELLGTAFTVSTIKIITAGESMTSYADYINTGKVIAIISGILLSIVIGFSVAAIIQYIIRIIFTFKYKDKIKYFGAIWGGMAITTIVYFLFVKGARGASFLTEGVISWFSQNTWLILSVSFLFFTLIFQLLYWFFKINILKVVVLAGTFALAMAFAGNDLVNFIGVPLAGLESYQIFTHSGSSDPTSFSMGMLNHPVKTPTLFLLISGIIMIVTLFISKKARAVTKTSVNLGRQDEGDETFQSSQLARGLVTMGLIFSKGFSFIMPKVVLNWINSRFTQVPKSKKNKGKEPAFDLLRASVILIVSSILIAMGTNLKLPLSTTYITFMVAMGASLSDRSWGRESAVYRVNGVITIIGGWFFTAIIAFILSGIIVSIIYFGGVIAIFAVIALAGYFAYRTQKYHHKKEEEESRVAQVSEQENPFDPVFIYHRCESELNPFIERMIASYHDVMMGFIDEKKKLLNSAKDDIKVFSAEIKTQRRTFTKIINKLDDDAVEAGFYYLQVLNQVKEIHGYLKQIFMLDNDYVDNHHPPFSGQEKTELHQIVNEVNKCLVYSRDMITKRNFSEIDEIEKQWKSTFDLMEKIKINFIHKLKKGEISERKCSTVLEILAQTSNFLDHLHTTVVIQEKFFKKIKTHKQFS